MVEHQIGIYQIKNTVTNKIYIGKSSHLSHRKIQHFSSLNLGINSNHHLQNSYNKYGGTAFEFSVLLYCEEAELNRYERAIISLYGNSLYNILGGGEGGPIPQETKEKISLSQIGKSVSLETRKKQSDVHKGIKQTPELIEKRISRIRGRHYSEEKKKEIYASRRNRKVSSETRNKLSAARKRQVPPMLGRHQSEETKEKTRETWRRKKMEREQYG